MEQLILMRIPPYQLPLVTDTLEEHDQLQTKEDDWITGCTSPGGVARVYEVTYKGEIEGVFQVAIELVPGTSFSSDTLTSRAQRRSFVPTSLARLLSMAKWRYATIDCPSCSIMIGVARARHMTMHDLVRYLHQQIIERLPREDEAELGSLSITLQELAQAADHYQDVQLGEILDDLSYVVNETLMGARVKGEWRSLLSRRRSSPWASSLLVY